MTRDGEGRLARRMWYAALGLILTFTCGCGGGKGNVSGTVTVEGKPLVMGTIVFTPERGPAVAADVVDGKYSVVGVPAGDIKVSLDLSNLKLHADHAAPKGGSAELAAKFGKGPDANSIKQKNLQPPKGKELPPKAKEQYEKLEKTSAEINPRVKEAIPMLKDIPDKYTDPNASGWTLKVVVGDNTFDAKVTK